MSSNITVTTQNKNQKVCPIKTLEFRKKVREVI